MTFGVMGILLHNRREQAPAVQEVLTRYGDFIMNRSGVHDPHRAEGFITLAVQGPRKEIDLLTRDLRAVEGVDVEAAFLPGTD